MANTYRNNLQVSPLNKTATILTLSLELNHRKKGEDYLNKLMEVYLERELLEKNQSAANTVFFIDQQLSGITDSLSYIEDRLEAIEATTTYLTSLRKVLLFSRDLSSWKGKGRK